MTLLFVLAACTADVGGPTGADPEDSGAPTESGGGTDTAPTPDSGDSGDSGGDTGPAPSPPACTVWGAPEQTGVVTEPTLNEISGVVPSVQNPGVLWVIEDHGNEAAVYALDATGALLATLVLDGTDNVDMEDLDLAPCPEGTCLVIADTGNNAHNRTDLALVVAPEPLLDGVTPELHAEAVRYGFTWPESEDNEALSHTDDGRFLLASKRQDKLSAIASLPAYVDGAVATVIATVQSASEEDGSGGGAATALSMWPDQHALLLRTYQYSWEFPLVDGIDSLAGSTPVELPTPIIPHDEGAAYDAVNRGYWTIPEAPIDGVSPVWWVPCVDGLG